MQWHRVLSVPAKEKPSFGSMSLLTRKFYLPNTFKPTLESAFACLKTKLSSCWWWCQGEMTWACGYGCPALALLALCTARKLSEGGWTRFICTRLGAARLRLCDFSLEQNRSWQGGCVPSPYVWVGHSGKIVIIWSNINILGSDPSATLHATVTAWKMLSLMLHCFEARSREQEGPQPSSLGFPRSVFSGTPWCYEMKSCRFVACCPCSRGCGISGRCIRICFASPSFTCQEIFPVDVPVVVALGRHGVRTEQLFPTGKEQLRQLLSVQCLCWYKRVCFSPVTGQSYLGLLGFIERNKLKE